MKVFWFVFIGLSHARLDNEKISRDQMKIWSDMIGQQIFKTANIITKYEEMQRRFQGSNIDVRPHNLTGLVARLSENIQNVFESRIMSIRKALSWAEEKALEHHVNVELGKVEDPEPVYVNAKKLGSLKPDPFSIQIELKEDPRFKTEVNFNYSAVHVPSSIYDKRADIRDGIHWSAGLDDVFERNYKENPTLMWQYFCSSLGFYRQYPAMKWPNDNGDRENPDLFDCRLRPWYTKSANSPKNIVVLYDVSGSMMGLRRGIARLVVSSILDTLTENDYVNVFNFSETALPVVPCYGRDQLVQANMDNIREFKVALDQHYTEGVANFTEALKLAFDVLERHRDEKMKESAHCNEAIMLITDGAPEYYDELWATRNQHAPTRVFTYLVGREVTDYREVKWMACTNKGYYARVTTKGEVEDKVIRYMNIMSRPMVMQQSHSVVWTNVYAHIAKVDETDWLWTDYNAKLQWQRSQRYKEFLRRLNNGTGEQFYVVDPLAPNTRIAGSKVARFLEFGMIEPNEHYVRSELAEEERIRQANLHRWGPERAFQFMISASMPVFDQRNVTIRKYEDQLHPYAEDEEEFDEFDDGKDKIASILGAVGTDVPIEELKKLTQPFRLGVNGYAFGMTQNGFIIMHPRWDPLFDEMLKPNYNSVDLSEIELVDSDDAYRNFEEQLMTMRNEMINIEPGQVGTATLKMRIPEEKFGRVKTMVQRYAFTKINSSEYTLAITIPSHQEFYMRGEIELHLATTDWLSYLEQPNEPRRWRLNPDWEYCQMIKGDLTDLKSPEDVLLYFLKKRKNAKSWKWKNTEFSSTRTASEIYTCDKELVQSLVFDANITQVFNVHKFEVLNNQIVKSLSAVMAFISTRSGLTRWVEFDNPMPRSATYIPFYDETPRATDESWYKRAVDRYYLDSGNSYVISVPYDAGTRDDALLTASRAIFVERGGRFAPAAVTGIQMTHKKFTQTFWNATSKCSPGINCNPCASPLNELSNMNCYIIDDSGIIISSSRHQDAGLFFGEVEGHVMEKMVEQEIYKRVKVVDYQGICKHSFSEFGGAGFLSSPLVHMKNVFLWVLGKIIWVAAFLINFDVKETWAQAVIEDDEELQSEYMDNPNWQPFLELAAIDETRLRPCHKEHTLYTYGPGYFTDLFSTGFHSGIIDECDDIGNIGFYGVHMINRTNLLMVMTDGLCERASRSYRLSLRGKEVQYPMDEELYNLSRVNPTISQICRVPYIPLHRKRPDLPCLRFNIMEDELRQECGKGNTLHYSNILLIGEILFSITIGLQQRVMFF